MIDATVRAPKTETAGRAGRPGHERSRARKLHALALALVSLGITGCATTSRFALRPPLLRDADDAPFAQKPAEDPESDYANTLDVILLGPLSRAFLLERPGEARNVNSLDEVPDSSWFSNRVVSPAAMDRGPCPDAGPAPPFTIKSSKVGGTTPGFQVKDSRGQKYLVKLDSTAPRQPEISTAADAVVSRLYWAIGFNAPCNDVVFIAPGDLRVDASSIEKTPTGARKPLTAQRLAEVLARATPGPNGTLRVSASRFIEGEPLGTWRTEGTRKDDPNDVIPHEDRRELRGERSLAAWVNHWDSRGPNSFDAWVKSKGGGHVVHYFLDFSDSLGATPIRTDYSEPRMGFTTVSNVPAIAVDAMGFGFVRRPWDEVKIDPRFPNIGYLDVEHFAPSGFAPQTPLVRWARAKPEDLAWMARKIARLGRDHVRVALRAGKLTNPAEEARLLDVLMGRREKILRASFAERSPLADLAVESGDSLCAIDLGVWTGLSSPAKVAYTIELRRGAGLPLFHPTPLLERLPASRVCVRLPPPLDQAGLPDDDAARYATLDVIRVDGAAKTTLRAHLYDLGPGRGFTLAGVERP